MGFSPSEKARLIGRVNTLEKANELLEMRVDKHSAALKKMSALIAGLADNRIKMMEPKKVAEIKKNDCKANEADKG